jgi:hypothetical protein
MAFNFARRPATAPDGRGCGWTLPELTFRGALCSVCLDWAIGKISVAKAGSRFLSIDGAATVVDTDEELPLFDLQCPMMSLPLAFKTSLDTIPGDSSRVVRRCRGPCRDAARYRR